MPDTPAFDDTVQQIEILREAARKLEGTKRFTIYRQVKEINAFLSTKSKQYKLREINETGWRDFAKFDSKKMFENREVFRAAWDWFCAHHKDIILPIIYQLSNDDGPDLSLAYISLAQRLRDAIPRSVNLDNHPIDFYRIAYDIPDDPNHVGFGMLNFESVGGVIEFSAVIPLYYKDNIDQISFSGTGLFHRHGVLLIGESMEHCLCTLNIIARRDFNRALHGCWGNLNITRENGKIIEQEIQVIKGLHGGRIGKRTKKSLGAYLMLHDT